MTHRFLPTGKCPACGTGLDEDGYCIDPGCVNVGKSVMGWKVDPTIVADNPARVERGRNLLIHYCVTTGEDDISPLFADGYGWTASEAEEIQTSLTDALADLMHFAAAYDFDVDGVLGMAQGHFQAERAGHL